MSLNYNIIGKYNFGISQPLVPFLGLFFSGASLQVINDILLGHE